MLLIFQIFENLVFLTFLGLGFYAIENARSSLTPIVTIILHGLSCGLIALLVTSTPVSLSDGATVDARAGPVVLAGVIAGPVGALIAASLGSIARGMVGGSFAFSGVAVFWLYGVLGTLFWTFLRKQSISFMKPGVVIALVLSSCATAASMFFLIDPRERAIAWLKYDIPYIFLANSLSILFSIFALRMALNVLTASRETDELDETLKLAKRASGFGIWDFDIRSGKLTWDENSKDMHGLSEDRFQGTFEDWAGAVHPDDLPGAQASFATALKGADSFELEYRTVLPDGQHRYIKGDAILLRDGDGNAVRVVGTNLDLTDMRATEEQLQEAQLVAVQAQKFETIGQLTGGVAHDFNNLLAVIMGNLELISDEIRRDHIDVNEIDVLLDASLESTRRGADLTRNMLAYARKARLTPVELNLNEIVRETENWIRRTIPSRIEIETNLQAGLWSTHADKSSLQSALVNLLVNARDALDASGQVTIETANLRIEEDYISERNEDVRPGRYVMLAVSDNGSGIDPVIMNSIFDPFFTTKQVGKGSGLGLSMVQGFVKQSGGAIRVYSELGVGTSFKMYFPAAASRAAEIRKVADITTEQAIAASIGKRVLLVEDRSEVLLVLKKTLLGAGYDVVSATSGDEGYDVFMRDGNFDVVVTDIVMPGDLQGPAMAREIRAQYPEMKFVFLSGYASEATVHGNGLKPEDIRLMKPVSRDALLTAVEICLNGSATPKTGGPD